MYHVYRLLNDDHQELHIGISQNPERSYEEWVHRGTIREPFTMEIIQTLENEWEARKLRKALTRNRRPVTLTCPARWPGLAPDAYR